MEPQIQYALTEDGVSIAYWTIGEGVPFILPHGSPTIGSLRAWRTPDSRGFLERLAAGRMLVRYDARGFGNSEAGTADFSLEARIRDLAAVVERVGARHVDLCAYLDSGPAMLAFAAANPTKVAHVVAWATSARGVQFLKDDVVEAFVALREADFEIFREAMIAVLMRFFDVGRGSIDYANSLREGITPEAAATFLGSQHMDVGDLLHEIQVPTLILHRRGIVNPPLANVQALAARIPGARLVTLDGDSSAPYVGQIEPIISAINEFLGTGSARAPRRSQGSGSLATILFTDLASSTALTQRLGDAKAQELVRAHNTIVREALAASGGSEIKHTGDGIMASFPTASGAIECAIGIQRGVASRNEPDLQAHIGVNAGEPVAEESDLFGTSVQLARRICDHASSGQILASNVVRELSAGKGFLFADIGEVAPKGFEEPVRLYEVRWGIDDRASTR